MKDVTPSGITWRNDGTGLGDDAHGNVLHDCVHRVQGAKKDKNAPRKPVIMKDSASSTSIAKIQYGFSEGAIWGLVDGAKSVILDGTPLEAIDGTKNFKNVTYDIRLGTNDQTYMKGFPDVSNEVGIGVELKSSAPYVRAINDTQLSAVRIRLRWGGLSSTNSENGDISGHRIDYAVDLQTDGGAYVEVLKTVINDKVSVGYERTHRIELPRATTGWQIRIRRLTPNSTSEFVRDTMYVDAIAEVIDAKFNYPNTAHMGIEFDSEIFRGIPKLEAHVRGMIVRVPTNYDPTTRKYTGMWDGLFKDAYTNNPAWIYYDIITAKRYGLGDRINPSMVDKWTVYALGVFCDQLVPDGLGGQEPRFTCNVYLQKTSDAYQVLSSLSGIFRAMAFWNGERIVLDADMPKDPVYTFSRANVIADENGSCFNHTGSRFRDRHTVVKVAWDNPANAFQTEYEYVRDEKAISKYGIRTLDLSAFGCTSQGQAQRAGLWALRTEQLETRQITFSVGLDGFLPQVADVINVADELFAGRANSGRVSAISAGQFVVTLDRDITVNAGDILIINGSDGKAERRVVKSAAGRKVTMVAAFTKAEQQNIWALETADLKLMRFRIMSIQENDDSSFSITALQHEPKKFPAIDYGADVIPDNITSITPDVIKAPSAVTITSNHRVVQGQTIATLVINWSQIKEAVGYDVEWRKDNGNWIKLPRTGNTTVEIEGVYAGNYTAQVRSVSAYDVSSSATFSAITEVKGKIGLPPTIVGLTVTGVLFGFDLNWSFGAGSGDAAFTEIQVATAPNVNVKQLGLYAYNTNKLQINGLMGNLSQSFRARLVDKLGFTSAWSAWVTGTTSASAAPIMDMIQGQINESSLNQALTSKIDKIDTNSSSISGIDTGLNKAKADIAAANAILDKAKADITTAKSVADLAKADSAANKIDLIAVNKTVGDNKTAVDQSVTTLTNKDIALTNLYTALKSEYDGNKATVTQELITLTNKDISLSNLLTALDTDYKGNKTAIRQELTAVSTKTDSTANSLTSLTTEVGKNKTAITTEATTRSTEDTALSNRITTVSGKTDNALSRITTAETTIANNAGAITQQKTDITAAYKKAIDNIEIGGKNLLHNSHIAKYTSTAYRHEYMVYAPIQYALEKLSIGDTITISFDIRMVKGDYITVYCSNTLGAIGFNPATEFRNIGTKKQRLSFVTEVVEGNASGNQTGLEFYSMYGSEDWYTVSNVKIEKGNKATAWTKAPEDVEAEITAAITRESTARTTAVEAVANTVTALDTRFEGNRANIENSLTVLTNKDIALTESVNNLTATVGGNTSNITNLQTTVSDHTQAIAQTRTDLTAKFNSLDIEGRNLLKNSAAERGTERFIDIPVKDIFKDIIGKTVTISFDFIVKAHLRPIQIYPYQDSGISIDRTDFVVADELNKWQRFSFVFSVANHGTPVGYSEGAIAFYDYSGINNYSIKNIKIEKGSKASAYSVAPEDIDTKLIEHSASISTVQNAVANNTQSIASTRTDLVAKIDSIENVGTNTFGRHTYISNGGFNTLAIRPSDAPNGFSVIGNSSRQGTIRLTNVITGNGWWTISFKMRGSQNSPVDLLVDVCDTNLTRFTTNTSNTFTYHTMTVYVSNYSADTYNFVDFSDVSWAYFWLDDIKVEKGQQATAWSAAPKDIAALSIEATATADKVSGLEAQYTVKLDVGGRVSGFGLASSTTQSDFAINADRFHIAPPTGSTKGTSPFMVLTAPQTINGTTVPAGTYMRSAYIHNGSIDTAKIKDAAIDSAKIGGLQVDTLHIKDFAVTIPRFYYNPNMVTVKKEQYGVWVTVATAAIANANVSTALSVGIDEIRGWQRAPSSSKYIEIGIFRNDFLLKAYQLPANDTTYPNDHQWKWSFISLPTILDEKNTSGGNSYTVKVRGVNWVGDANNYNTYNFTVTGITLTAIGTLK